MGFYAVKVEHDEPTGAYIVSCRDLPLLNSVGTSLADALLEAKEGILTALEIEEDEGRPIPEPSKPLPDEHVVFF